MGGGSGGASRLKETEKKQKSCPSLPLHRAVPVLSETAVLLGGLISLRFLSLYDATAAMIHDNAAEAAALRVAVLQGHLARREHGVAAPSSSASPPTTAFIASPVSAPDDGEDPTLVQYSVALPERLDAPGPWAVRRCENDGAKKREKGS